MNYSKLNKLICCLFMVSMLFSNVLNAAGLSSAFLNTIYEVLQSVKLKDEKTSLNIILESLYCIKKVAEIKITTAQKKKEQRCHIVIRNGIDSILDELNRLDLENFENYKIEVKISLLTKIIVLQYELLKLISNVKTPNHTYSLLNVAKFLVNDKVNFENRDNAINMINNLFKEPTTIEPSLLVLGTFDFIQSQFLKFKDYYKYSTYPEISEF